MDAASAEEAPIVIPTDRFDAVVFDMDGVITDTASTHHEAWKSMFDAYLAATDASTRGFTEDDYRAYVDGRPREDGVATFLAARGLHLPMGSPGDPPGTPTVWGLANRKNELFSAAVAEHGVRVFDSSVALVRRIRTLGLPCAVVTASQNADAILAAAGMAEAFDIRVDGRDITRLALPGKPDPAPFLEAARRLRVDPARAVVVEDAVAGVEAARAGGFGLVIGVDRDQQRGTLLAHGAHVVVQDLADVVIADTRRDQHSRCGLCDEAPRRDPRWTFESCNLAMHEQGTREALFTLGNGYTATRGAAAESTDDGLNYPGTYVAGVFNRLASTVEGRTRVDESIVNLPNWLVFTFRPEGGTWFTPMSHAVLHDHWVLDIGSASMQREVRVEDDRGRRTTIREQRLVCMAAPHLAGQSLTITAENWSGSVTLRSGIDARVRNTNVEEYADLSSEHLVVTDRGDHDDQLWVVAETNQSRVRTARALRTRVAGTPTTARRLVENEGLLAHDVDIELSAGLAVVIEKVSSIFTSHDHAIAEPLSAAREALTHAAPIEELVAEQRVAWGYLWDQFGLSLADDDHAQLVLNLHLLHLLQTLSIHTGDLDVGVPARGLHGEGYRGHYFWDEIFVFGLLNTRAPQLTRQLLMYRARRLPSARRLALDEGLRGARYPWQAGSDGREETPVALFNPHSRRWMADNSRRQFHVNLAVAYNIWQYWQVTGDLTFLRAHGAEMLFEIARFWTTLATYDSVSDRYEIRAVMGPDEFHDGYPDRPGEGIDNNAYTNVMVAWLMHRALETIDLIGPRDAAHLQDRMAIGRDERRRWEHMTSRLLVPHHDGIMSQFSGYEDLFELDWSDYRARYHNIGRLDLILEAEGDKTNRYKASKQADVLMLFYLLSADELRVILHRLGYDLTAESIPRTIEYYLRRTSHGSTLSRVVHSWVLARSDRAHSWSLFDEALQADIADTQGGTTREGIHLGAMAGTVDIVQRCYTGLETRNDTLYFNPLLPDELRAIEFDITFRGHQLTVHIDHHHLEFASHPGAAPPIRIGIRDDVFELSPGDDRTITWTHPMRERAESR